MKPEIDPNHGNKISMTGIDEYNEIGGDKFLNKYGFGRSTKYFILLNGMR